MIADNSVVGRVRQLVQRRETLRLKMASLLCVPPRRRAQTYSQLEAQEQAVERDLAEIRALVEDRQ